MPSINKTQFDEVRIENTNKCFYKCFFCPREKLSRPTGFMSTSDLRLVIERVGPHRGKVDLHGYGEPLLDPNLKEKVRLVRNLWPLSELRIYSTLGVELAADYFDELFDAGLDILEVSYYGRDEPEYRKIHGSGNYAVATLNLNRAIAANPHRVVLRLMPSSFKTDQVFGLSSQRKILEHLAESSGVKVIRERALHNWGSGRKFNMPGNKICSVVSGYRSRVLQITWDLNVIPCCFDFNASIVLGNLRSHSVREILESHIYRLFIESHKSGSLEAYPVCAGCERCTLE
jgi:MoaA/NifB/PqqE/SkfB family radical SAM enzyme